MDYTLPPHDGPASTPGTGGIAMYAINFYTQVYEDMLVKGRKTATIRLGDKKEKYQPGQIIWITVGHRFGRRRKLFAAIIDSVVVKTVADVSPRELDRENPEMRTHEELTTFLSRIYDRPVAMDDIVTVVHFSPITE
jgi:hypothetical protein